MHSKRSLRIFSGLAGVFLAAAAQGQILNGGFESPTVSAGTFAQFFSGSSIGGAWTVGGNDVLNINTTYSEPGLTFNAFSGLNALDLTGAGNTGLNTISQTIPITVPGVYTLSFYLGRINDGGASYNGASSVSVSLDGLAQGAFFNPNQSVGVVNWVQVQVPLLLSAGPHTITFTNLTPNGNNYTGLDEVTLVTAVPEPTTWLAAGGALALVSGTIARRRRKA